MRTVLVVALAACVLAVPMTTGQLADNGIKSCGDMELFIANPDMRDVGEDGAYHVAGDFYMQFQVQGDGASDIESFGFSVGIPPENPEEVCSSTPAPWWSGFMLESYKADFDKSDGFFILMSTTSESTPQNTELTVSVHAYDGEGTEQARFWTTAYVESCQGPVAPEGCSDEDVIANDRIQPWPMVLPGDGPQDFVDGIYIDFAEPLAEGGLTVYLNGEDITDQLQSMSDAARKQWDADTYYDHGPAGIGSTLTQPCQQPQTCKAGEGPAYQWTERKMTPDDVVRVEAVDRAGNVAVKEIHMAQAAAGGTLEGGIPILEMTFDQTSRTGAPGDEVRFTMVMENTGSGEGHPFAEFAEGDTHPQDWPEPTWEPGHEPVPPKGSATQDFVVTIPQNATDGTHSFKPRMTYKQAGVDNSVQSALSVMVELPEEIEPDGELNEEQEAPATGLVALLAGIAVLAALRKRT